jgi:hypothetical protein
MTQRAHDEIASAGFASFAMTKEEGSSQRQNEGVIASPDLSGAKNLSFDLPLKIRILSLNLPLKVRGIKGVISITPLPQLPFPSYLKRGIFGKIDEIRLLRWQNRLVICISGFGIV